MLNDMTIPSKLNIVAAVVINSIAIPANITSKTINNKKKWGVGNNDQINRPSQHVLIVEFASNSKPVTKETTGS